jgi:hypothetical protein
MMLHFQSLLSIQMCVTYGGEYEGDCLLGCLLAASIIRMMMEAASTSETSVNLYQTTRRNSSEDSHLHPDVLRKIMFV